jgi:hypothetical protein
MSSILPRYSTFKVIPRCGPQRGICFGAVGHSAEFVSALWTTARNFAKCCGTLRRMALYEKTKNVPLWATAKRLIPRCGPLRGESFCAVTHSAKFDLPLWAPAQRFFLRCGPQRGMIDHSAESNELHLKACRNIKKNNKEINYISIKYSTKDLYYPCLKSVPAM